MRGEYYESRRVCFNLHEPTDTHTLTIRVELFVIYLCILAYNVYSFGLWGKFRYTYMLFLGLMFIMRVFYIFTFVFEHVLHEKVL